VLADRLAALAAFDALPIETNQLYTTYVDLRNAKLAAAAALRRCCGDRARRRRREAAPRGAAAYVELRENRVAALVLSDEARDAGVILETLTQLRARDPDLLRQLLEGRAAPARKRQARTDDPRPVV